MKWKINFAPIQRIARPLRRAWAHRVEMAVTPSRDGGADSAVRWELSLPPRATGWVRLDFALDPPAKPAMPRVVFRRVLDVFAFRHPRTGHYSVYIDLNKTGRSIAVDPGDAEIRVLGATLLPTSEPVIAMATICRHWELIPELALSAWRSFVAAAAGNRQRAAYHVRTAGLRISQAKNVSLLKGTAAYAAIAAREPPPSEPAPLPSADALPIVSFVLEPGPASDGLVQATVASLVAQSHGSWELLATTGQAGDSRDPRLRKLAKNDSGLEMKARGAYVSWIRAGDRLAPHTVSRIAAALAGCIGQGTPVLIYSDEDLCDAQGRRKAPFLKPAWSPEFLESTFYIGRLAAYRMDLVRGIGGLREELGTAAEFDLALRVTEGGGKVVHVPEVLYHRLAQGTEDLCWGGHRSITDVSLAERALAEHVARGGGGTAIAEGGVLHARFEIRGEPTLSIVIPTAGRSAMIRGRTINLLQNCITSLRAKAGWEHVEWVIVHNNDLEAETLAFLRSLTATLVGYGDPQVNIAAKMNLGARAATGGLFLFLNDDIEARSNGVLAEMIQIAQRPGVGAVGVKLYFEDGTIQHGGTVLPGALPFHLYAGVRDDSGYFGSLVATRNTLAVTGACLLTPRQAFEEVGGFDENLRINYNDIDLALKLVDHGYRIVFTPHAQLYHFESKSRDPARMYWDEAEYFARKWMRFANNDPYYSRWFAGSGSFALRA